MDQQGQLKIDGKLLGRNTLYNFIGQLLPLIVAVAAMPAVIRGLGTERFGILTIIWVVVGYFGIFNLGLGPATTKYAAEALGKGETEKLPGLVWTSFMLQLPLGIVGALIMVSATPLLVEKVLHISPEFLLEARATFYIMAASLPVMMVIGNFNGVLAAGQRFGLINAVRVPSSSLTYIIPLVGLSAGLGLPGIVLLILISKIGVALAYMLLCFRVFPSLKKAFRIERVNFRPLFTFGGWVTVSGVVGPFLVYLERFLIGSILGMTMLTYYTAPYEIVARLWIIPGSMVAALFPAFSALSGSRVEELGKLYMRSVKYILLIMVPVVLIIILFAPDILRMWLGADFAAKSSAVFQILAIGIFAYSLAEIPFNFLKAQGRPDIPAKFHLIELPIFVFLAWFLVGKMGIAGAALAWTLRVGLDMLFLYIASYRLFPSIEWGVARNGLRRAIFSVSAFVLIVLLFSMFLDTNLLIRIAFFGLAIATFISVVWFFIIDSKDRDTFLSVFENFI